MLNATTTFIRVFSVRVSMSFDLADRPPDCSSQPVPRQAFVVPSPTPLSPQSEPPVSTAFGESGVRPPYLSPVHETNETCEASDLSTAGPRHRPPSDMAKHTTAAASQRRLDFDERRHCAQQAGLAGVASRATHTEPQASTGHIQPPPVAAAPPQQTDMRALADLPLHADDVKADAKHEGILETASAKSVAEKHRRSESLQLALSHLNTQPRQSLACLAAMPAPALPKGRCNEASADLSLGLSGPLPQPRPFGRSYQLQAEGPAEPPVFFSCRSLPFFSPTKCDWHSVVAGAKTSARAQLHDSGNLSSSRKRNQTIAHRSHADVDTERSGWSMTPHAPSAPEATADGEIVDSTAGEAPVVGSVLSSVPPSPFTSPPLHFPTPRKFSKAYCQQVMLQEEEPPGTAQRFSQLRS